MADVAEFVTNKALIEKMEELGIIQANKVSRVVIDIQAGHVPVIHIQQFGDTRLLDVVPTLDGVEIVRTDG